MTLRTSHRSGIVIVASPVGEFRHDVARVMSDAGWVAKGAETGAGALARVEETDCSLLLLDSALPDLTADEVVDLARDVCPGMEVLLMDRECGRFRLPAGHSASTQTREALERLRESTPEASASPEPDALPRATPSLPSGPPPLEPLPRMVGRSPAMADVYHLVRLVAPRATPVLVTGETGTGKELVARAVHECSPRRKEPFVVVNCAAIPGELLEAELFGFERGAFTGAIQSRAGRIRTARGGTLFLDEIGEMPGAMQAKLLRFLQEGEIQRLGSAEVSHVDTRVVAATNVDLGQHVEEGRFREDLFYRMAVFPIGIAPLRERREDILPLAEHFLNALCREARVPAKTISARGAETLRRHPWPGNVRELQHAVERAFILSGDSSQLLVTPRFTPLRGTDSLTALSGSRSFLPDSATAAVAV